MAAAKSVSMVREQPRLRVEHRVMVAPADGLDRNQIRKLEKMLDDFYVQHGPAWELVNMFRMGTSDFVSNHQELLFVFQRRAYQTAMD
ncbi:MAG: hypothetical protein AB7O49_18425 [Sphingomonadales bacterium]